MLIACAAPDRGSAAVGDAELKSHVRSPLCWKIVKPGLCSSSAAPACPPPPIGTISRPWFGPVSPRFRPVIVHSALSGITDRLESLLAAAVSGTHSGVLEQIDAAAPRSGARLRCRAEPAVRAASCRSCGKWRIRSRAAASCSDELRARVMAMGELLGHHLGSDVLERPGNRYRVGGCAPGAARRYAPRRHRKRRACCRRLAISRRIRPCSRAGGRSIRW